MKSKQINIVFILGTGRSGSTLLNMMLGSCQDLFSLGDFIKFPEWVEQNRVCTCGKAISQCSFWTEVLIKSGAKRGNKLDNLKKQPASVFQTLLSTVKILLSGKSLSFSIDKETLYQIFYATHEISEAQWLIDSSKQAWWLMELYHIPNIRLKVLHLVRDGRGYIHSKQKLRIMETPLGIQKSASTPVCKATIYCMLMNFLSMLIGRKFFKNDYRLVRYEDLTSNPEREIQAIFEFLGVPFEKINFSSPISGEYHNIAGNNSKFSGFKVIKQDDTWKYNLSPGQKMAFVLLGGWLNCFFFSKFPEKLQLR